MMTPDCQGHWFSGSPEIREWRVLTRVPTNSWARCWGEPTRCAFIPASLRRPCRCCAWSVVDQEAGRASELVGLCGHHAHRQFLPRQVRTGQFEGRGGVGLVDVDNGRRGVVAVLFELLQGVLATSSDSVRWGGVHRSRLTSCISGRAGRRCAARCTARRGVGTQRTATSSCARPRRTRPVTAQRVVARRVRTDSTGPERNLGEASRMETRPFRTSELCPLSDRYDADSTRAAGLTARQDQLEQGQQRQFRTPARSA